MDDASTANLNYLLYPSKYKYNLESTSYIPISMFDSASRIYIYIINNIVIIETKTKHFFFAS